MTTQILILGFKGVMKTLFSIVVDGLERVTLHYVHNKRHLSAGSFLRWLTGIETVNYNTKLFLAMFEEKQIKIYFTLMSVQCIAKWFVLYLGKASFTTLQCNFLHSICFQVIVHVHV